MQTLESIISQQSFLSKTFGGAILSTLVDAPMAKEVATILGADYVDPGIRSFLNSEYGAQIQQTVRKRHVFLIGAFARDLDGHSSNDAIMQFLVVLDALMRASAESITLVIPYFGYAKQERKKKGRQPLSASLVMNMFTSYLHRISRIIIVDLHAPAIQGFINLPVDNITARPELLKTLREQRLCGNDVVVVSPDAGGGERTHEFAVRLNSSFAVMTKQRSGPEAIESTTLAGDVRGKVALIIDDMVMTGGTLFAAAEKLVEAGATRVVVAATHADFCGDLVPKLMRSVVDRLIVTNTLPLVRQADVASCPKIQVVSIYNLLAETIRRNYVGESVSQLFD